MDRRLLSGLVVLGVAIAVGAGILVFGGSDDSDGDATTNATLSNDERPDPSAETDPEGAGGNDKGGNGNEGSQGGNGGDQNTGSTGGSDDSGSDEPNGPPIEQDPPNNGGGNDQPVGDPTEVAAVTDTLTTYLESVAAGDGEGACEQLSESGVKTMLKKIGKAAPETRGAACPQAILLYQGAYGETAQDPSFKSIEVSGGSATAVGPLKEPARLSQTSDGWLIDEYGQ